MPSVRPLDRSDLPQVVDLFIETFRPERRAKPEAVRTCFETVYLENPWFDPEIPSLVYDDGAGRVLGFLGAVPRPMQSGGAPLRAAVIGNLMVDGETAGALASVQLLKACMRGRQDLTLTDSAGDESRRAWELSGGVTARTSSLRWLRPLRPLSLAAERYLARRAAPVRNLLTPVSRLGDVALRSTRLGPFRNVEHGCTVQDLRSVELPELIANLRGYAIVPRYEPAALEWLLEEAARKLGQGQLRRCLVRDRSSGEPLGWYVYYLKRRATSEVLQLGGDPSTIARVFACLSEEAYEGGANALSGRLDPQFMYELSWSHSTFFTRSWVLVHARDAKLVDFFHRGEAFFSGLEGEQWMRFMSDPFEQ